MPPCPRIDREGPVGYGAATRECAGLSPMLSFLASIGAMFLAFLAATGRIVLFTGQAIAAGATPPYYPRLLLRQIVNIGYFSLPVVGLTAISTVVVLSMTRELGPVIAGLMVAGRVGAAMAAEIGTMRVTDQIDALTTLS